ncbi:MAG TPA: dihydroorotase [Chloroflexota bacterium]|nr:dihydroorotase [Chloroflexota bacterium]
MYGEGDVDILIQGGRVVDPGRDVDRRADVWIRNGVIDEITDPRPAPEGRRGLLVIDASEQIVCPGLVDVHTHLRDPGQEEKETIATGALAAVQGGFTSVCCMANTSPPVDNRALVEYILRTANGVGLARVYPLATVTRGMNGRELTEMADLADAGAVAFSDDGKPVMNSAVMRHALEYSRLIDRPIMVHEEDASLTNAAVMNEGPVATRLGLKGWPGIAEEILIARDLLLLEHTGGRLHLAHVTTAGGVDLIRRARERGLRFTAEVTPHHLTMTDEWVAGYRPSGNKGIPYDTDTKVNPPLRTEHDRQALIEAVRDGTIDFISTDHAPHSEVDKLCEYGAAAFGFSGLETALGSLLGLVHEGLLDLSVLIRRLTVNAAHAFNLPAGELRPGAPGDICIFDPGRSWIVDPSKFASKGKNTPLKGQVLRGQVTATICRGRLVYLNKDCRTIVSGAEVPA